MFVLAYIYMYVCVSFCLCDSVSVGVCLDVTESEMTDAQELTLSTPIPKPQDSPTALWFRAWGVWGSGFRVHIRTRRTPKCISSRQIQHALTLSPDPPRPDPIKVPEDEANIAAPKVQSSRTLDLHPPARRLKLFSCQNP